MRFNVFFFFFSFVYAFVPTFAVGMLASTIRITRVTTPKENKAKPTMKTRKYSQADWHQQLVWVQTLTQSLYYAECLPYRECLRLAHLTRRLLELMGEGAVAFTYLKSDGTERHARGTLATGIDPLLDAYEPRAAAKSKRTPDSTEGIYYYWDLEKHQFRTFKSSQLLSIDDDDHGTE